MFRADACKATRGSNMAFGQMKTLVALLALAVTPPVAADVLNSPPTSPDPHRHYAIYLHGAVVTGSDGRPTSSYFGVYEYHEILEALAVRDLIVISEIRAQDSDQQASVRRVIEWIGRLKEAGVPSENIGVIGASLGGIIGAQVSHALADREIRYVFIASMYRMSSVMPFSLNGRVLTLYDASDKRDWVADDYFAKSPDLAEQRVIVTQTGLGHGLLYKPHPAWLNPAVEWIKHSRGPNNRPQPTR
jgi:acetyl esterase/lipase